MARRRTDTEREINDYGLKIKQSEDKDRLKIDFELIDKEDVVASVWGKSAEDTQVECEHPYGFIEWEDDETVGECLICGATCDWHEEISNDDGYLIRERVPHDWHMPKDAGGVIGRYVKETWGK